MMDYAHCAPLIDPQTIAAIVQVESGGNPLAINVNGRGAIRLPPAPDADSAAELVAEAVRGGFSVDIGLMQVNSRNLPALGLTVREAFDPCVNVSAGSAILLDAYRRGVQLHGGPGQAALRAALSAYNTGHPERGIANGYVARYYGPAFLPRPSAPARPTFNPYTAPPRVYERKDSNAKPIIVR